MLSIALLIILVTLLYFYTQWSKGYFARRGVKNRPYSVPFVGNMMKSVLKKEHFMDLVHESYNAFPDQKYIGHMQFTIPYLMVRDLDLLKQLTVKDFDHFVNHYGGISEITDPMFGKNLFSLKGDMWRDMRATLSPAFTSSKMRNMFQFMEEIAKQSAEFHMEEMKKPQNRERGLLEVEMRDVFTRYSNDVIASSAYGFKIDSLRHPDNPFYQKGKEAANFPKINLIKFIFIVTFPRICKLFNLRIFSEQTCDYFRNLVLGTMKNREETGIVRNDMIQLLMEAKKGSLKHEKEQDDRDAGFATVEESQVGRQSHKRQWTDDDLVAQALIFFVAGFDSASTLLCFMAHELAANRDIQKKLQDEIDGIVQMKGSTLDYGDLTMMKYMDMVVTETLRKWPPGLATDRVCVKPYTMPPPTDDSDAKYQLNVGDPIWIPIYGIHHDPKYYPNPEKFDPERFSDENKHNLNPFAFMPFGLGPRNCIGSRFALLECKVVLFHLLAKFDLVMTAKTDHPIKISKHSFNLYAENGFWLGLKPRV